MKRPHTGGDGCARNASAETRPSRASVD